jgi:hypothetical protein
MLPYSEADFCSKENGLDYVFGKMSAIYGSTFTRHWEGVDPKLVRQVWLDDCGKMLTYKPKLDYALKHMNQDRPPSALAFAKLLSDGPRIPDKPNFHIGFDEPVPKGSEVAVKSMEKIRQILKEMKAA